MRKYLPWLFRLIGPTLLALFLANSDLEQLGAELAGTHPGYITLSLLMIAPFMVVKAWRWQRVMRELTLDLPLHTATFIYTIGIYLGSVTPGQAGDLVKAWYLRERGHPLAPALLSVVIDRLFDMIIMAGLAVLGIFALGNLLPGQGFQTALVLAIGAGLIFLMIVLMSPGPREWTLTRALPTVLPQRLHDSLHHWNTQFSTLAMHPRLVLDASIASLISAVFSFFRLWLLFIALDVHIPFYVVVGGSALIAILQVVPISVAGVGVRDAVLVAILLPYGYSTEQALGVSALFLLLTMEQILLGFVLSFWYPIGKKLSQVVPEQPVPETTPE